MIFINDDCPFCEKEIDGNVLEKEFEESGSEEEFEMPCPHCGNKLYVVVRFEDPTFYLFKDEQ